MKLEKVTDASGASAKRWYGDACGTALALEFVGERWALLVIRELLLGPRRFGEIRAGLPGISANILTQRLAGLEGAGVLFRHRLAPPANAQVYELTPWGREAEPIVMALGRWALRSPDHDPSLPFSRVSLMLSLKMMLVRERIGDFAAAIGFRLGDEAYVARVGCDGIAVARGGAGGLDATLSGEPSAFLPLLYGGMPLAAAEAAGLVRVEGDREVAGRFATLFALPPKIGAEA